MTILFVGERRSERAKQLNVTWRDGALAGKQLFDALRKVGFEPTEAEYCNLFEGKLKFVRRHRGPVVAMGKIVQERLRKEGIQFIPMIHPAARGKIRAKRRYAAHVGSVLRKII